MIPLIAAVAVGGVAGTLIRFASGNWINANWPRHFYTATLAVNIVGCLLIGILYGLFLIRPEVPIEVRAGLMVGFLGGLTTFSSFSLDGAPARKRASATGTGLCGPQRIRRAARNLGWPVPDQTLINEKPTCSIPNCYVATFRT